MGHLERKDALIKKLHAKIEDLQRKVQGQEHEIDSLQSQKEDLERRTSWLSEQLREALGRIEKARRVLSGVSHLFDNKTR